MTFLFVNKLISYRFEFWQKGEKGWMEFTADKDGDF